MRSPIERNQRRPASACELIVHRHIRCRGEGCVTGGTGGTYSPPGKPHRMGRLSRLSDSQPNAHHLRDALVDRLAGLRLEERRLAQLSLLRYSEAIHAYGRLCARLQQIEKQKPVSSETLLDLAAQCQRTLSSAAMLAFMDSRDSPTILGMTPTENDPRSGEVVDIDFAVQDEECEKLTALLTTGIQQTGICIDKIRRSSHKASRGCPGGPYTGSKMQGFEILSLLEIDRIQQSSHFARMFFAYLNQHC
jgi:hypothetical protein